uniref:Shisa N-terminal domain-containing protein n=1 Tax=Geospiza parvula TaxID=87175 RepID=A0A8C3NJN6_GEOPR
MGPRHLLLPPLLLLSLQLLALLPPLPLPAQAAGPPRAKGNRTQGAAAARRTPKPGRELLNQTLAGPGAAAPTALPGRGKGAGGGKAAPGGGGSAPAHETCWGYYDVSGQWDKEFECNNSLTGFRYCCGTCFYRFCCNKRAEKLNQSLCRNYKSPEWAHPTTASGALPADGGDGGDGDANKYDPDKDSTNATVYISCGAIAFVLIAGVFAKVAYDKARRPPREMNIHRYFHEHSLLPLIPLTELPPWHSLLRVSLPVPGMGTCGHSQPPLHPLGAHSTPAFLWFFADKPRMNNILTSATEPYDLSFSRSFQNLSHLPPSYESAVKTNPSKYSSLKRLTDKEADEYYMRRRHLPDLAARGTLPINVIKMSQQGNQRDRPRRPIRAMSQDRVLSPERIMPEEFSMSYERILSDEQLLSAERLHSQDPLLSPERSAYPEQSMSRALSHTDVFVSTPVLDRYRMSKMHSHPSRRHNTVEQLHYIPGHHHHYRTASKTEVTV